MTARAPSSKRSPKAGRAALYSAAKNSKKKSQEKRIETLRATSVDANSPALAAAKSPDRPLTDKQKLFIKHWAAGDSILGAAHRAGYSDNGTIAYRMVKDPAILARYQDEKRKYEAAAGMTRQKVMDGLSEAIEMARVMADPMAMISGWREVGKMCGYYAPVTQKIDVNISGGNNIFARLNRMSDAELLKLVEDEKMTLEADFREIPQLALEGQEADLEEMAEEESA